MLHSYMIFIECSSSHKLKLRKKFKSLKVSRKPQNNHKD